MNSIKVFFKFSVPVLILFLGIAEGVLRIWFPVDDPFVQFKERYDFGYIPSQLLPDTKIHFRSEEGLPGIDTGMDFSTNNIGFRGDPLMDPKPGNEFRVFLIGGSTAQCLHVDDSRSIERVVQNKLRSCCGSKNIKVYNTGKSGDATPDHIAMLSQKILHLQPDLVIVFSGLNDFRREIIKPDYPLHQPEKIYYPSSLLLALTDLQLARRMYDVLKKRPTAEVLQTLALQTNFKALHEIQESMPLADSMPAVQAATYSANLHSIAGMCEANRLKLIFMTNQSSWDSIMDKRLQGFSWMLAVDSVRYNGKDMAAGLEVFNDTMRAIASRRNIPLLDIGKAFPKSADYFYDDCHFNISGADSAGNELAVLVKQMAEKH